MLTRMALGVAGCALLCGCLGPSAVSHTRTRYNEVYRDTNDEQLLLNIVRLRYADSPVFVDLPNITSQFEISGGGSYTYGLDGAGPGQSNLGFGSLALRDTPTISYHPRGGRDIAKALLTPLSTELLSVVNAGATIEQFLLLAVNDINDVQNATRATVLTPAMPDDNAEFREGVRQIAALALRGAVELVVTTTDSTEGASDPIPVNLVQGRDLVNAAKEGYVFRARREGEVAIRKREKGLLLQVRPSEVDSVEMQNLARAFRLKPGLATYKVKSELAIDSDEGDRPGSEPGDTIYMNMRSILQILTFLSKGVSVPQEHVLCGIAPMTAAADGVLFDWNAVTEGLFCVQAQKRRPKAAEVAVRYRGYWFYIAANDVQSRATLAILELLFAVQESEGKPMGPTLTLPLG